MKPLKKKMTGRYRTRQTEPDEGYPSKRPRLKIALAEESSDDEEVELSDNEVSDDEMSDEDEFIDDSNPLIEMISSRVGKLFPDLRAEDINQAVEEALVGTVIDYSGESPDRWKSRVDPKDLEKLETDLLEIRSSIEDDFPKIEGILQSELSLAKKKEALRYLDILHDTEKNTVEYIKLADQITGMIKVSSSPEEKRIRSSIVDIDIDDLGTVIMKLDANDGIKAGIYQMHDQLQKLEKSTPEYSNLRQKIDWAVSLPYRKMSSIDDVKDLSPGQYCKKVFDILNKELYGMNSAKERIIQIVNNRVSNPNSKALIALKGAPGTGKTAIAQVLANAVNLPFERISLGGMEDPSIFKGTDSSWVGATPSILLHILRRMKVSNGVVLFDEIDKLSNSPKAKEIQHALLHITDYLQNAEFRDQYLNEFTFDLSKIWFMFSMNDDLSVDPVLKDRLDIINIDPYTSQEIVKIIQLHILPKTLKDLGLNPGDVTISEQACNHLQSIMGKDMKKSGLRSVESAIHQILSRLNMLNSIIRDDIDIKLSYTLSKFKGFPYQIIIDTVQKLSEKKHETGMITMMYM